MGRKTILRRLWHEERAQDTLEMLLVTGALVVAIVIGLLPAFEKIGSAVIGHACDSIDTASTTSGAGSCLAHP